MLSVFNVQQMFNKKRSIFQQSLDWYPLPAVISFCLSIVFVGHLFRGINPRSGIPVQPIVLPSPEQEHIGIWFALKLRNNQLLVYTDERKMFSWPQNLSDRSGYDKFCSFLQTRVKREVSTSILAKSLSAAKIYVTISVDEQLTYFHMRPIISALSKAKLRQYSFETRNQ